MQPKATLTKRFVVQGIGDDRASTHESLMLSLGICHLELKTHALARRSVKMV
jgi:hypothetical protein